MPLMAGTSSDIVSSNIDELEHGRVVGRTRRKYGKKRAQKQAVAIELNEKRKSQRKKTKRKT